RVHLHVHVRELRISIRMLAPFEHFPVALEAVLQRPQEVGHDPLADRVPLVPQRRRELPQALAGPPQWRFGIPARGWLDQPLQRRRQAGVVLYRRLPSTTRPPDPTGWPGLARLQVPDPS